MHVHTFYKFHISKFIVFEFCFSEQHFGFVYLVSDLQGTNTMMG